MVAVKGPKGPGKKKLGGNETVLRRGSLPEGQPVTMADALLDGGVSLGHPAVKVKGSLERKPVVPAAAAAPVAEAPAAIDTALGVANTVVNTAGFAALPVFLASGLGGEVITDAAKLAQQGWFARNIRQPIAKAIGKITTPTIGQVGKKLGIDGIAHDVVQPVANFTGDVVENNFKGVTNRIRDRSVSKAAGHHAVLKQQISDIHASNVHPELKGYVSDIHSELHKSDFRKIDTHRLSESMQKFEKKAGELVQNGAQKEVDVTVRSMSNLGGRAEKFMTSSAAVSRYENVGKSIKSIPGNMAKISAFHGVVNASFAGASVLSMANDLRSFTKQLVILKRMYADMTGTDVSKVSTTRVLFGSAPAPVRMARASMLKFAAISEIADAIGLVVNVKGMMGKGFSMMTGLIAYQLPQMISGTAGKLLNQEELQNYLAAYDHASNAQAAGQKISAEDYAQLLHFADPDLKNKSSENPFLGEVANQFAQSQTSAADVLNATANGDVTLRLSKLRVDNAAAEKTQEVTAQAVSEPNISYVEREHARTHGAAEGKAVHGAFTQKEVARTNGNDVSPVATR